MNQPDSSDNTSASERYDVIIVGCGIIGAATAYHLLSESPGLRVLLMDREGAGQGNTAKSVAMIRDTFTSPPSYSLSTATIHEFRRLHDELPGGIGLNRMMYLWLFTGEQRERNSGAIDELTHAGVDIELLDAEELHRRAPCMVTKPEDDESRAYRLPPVTAALLCRNCYSVDPLAVTGHYVNEFKKLGGKTLFGSEVADLIRRPLVPLSLEGEELPDQPFPSQEQTVAGVRLDDGTEIKSETTILATGAWSREITDKLGTGSLLSPKKRQWFYVEAEALSELMDLPAFGNEDGTLPFTIMPQGMYLKPSREGGFYVAFADNMGRPFNLDVAPEKNYFVNCIHPFIKGYFPQFEHVSIKAMDAGSYCYDEVYRTPLVDWIHEGVMLVAGASGSGIMKADAIGRVAAHRYELRMPGYGISEQSLELPGGVTINTDVLTIRGRGKIEPERLVI